jgi:cytoskeletal protein RodZ
LHHGGGKRVTRSFQEREEGGFVNTTLLIVIVVVVVVVVAALVAFFVFRRGQQRGRQEAARQEYGPEYERTVEERGSEREAEQELRERRERVESEVRPLSEESKKRYTERWRRVEQTFVDDPTASLNDADRVVSDILEERTSRRTPGRRRARASASRTRELSRTSGRPSAYIRKSPVPAIRTGRIWRRCARPSRNTDRCTSA